MRPQLTEDGWKELGRLADAAFGRTVQRAELQKYGRQVELSVDKALTPTAELKPRNKHYGALFVVLEEHHVEWLP